jgi:hypothetical protein
MRVIVCLLLLLTACASKGVRCDRHLRPINPPESAATAGTPSERSVK